MKARRRRGVKQDPRKGEEKIACEREAEWTTTTDVLRAHIVLLRDLH